MDMSTSVRGPCIISPACRAISTTAEGRSIGANQFAIHMLQSVVERNNYQLNKDRLPLHKTING